jgi:hypothetical protein
MTHLLHFSYLPSFLPSFTSIHQHDLQHESKYIENVRGA